MDFRKVIRGEWSDIKGNAKYEAYRTVALLLVVGFGAAVWQFLKGLLQGLTTQQKWNFGIAFGLLLFITIVAVIVAILATRRRGESKTVAPLHDVSPPQLSLGAPSVLDEPSIVMAFHFGEEEYDEDTGEKYSPEFLSFTNVGHEAATNVTLHPIGIADRRVTVSEVSALMPNGLPTDVRIFGLTGALRQARKKMRSEEKASPIRVKLTLTCGTRYQHDGLRWEYALTDRQYGNITIKRISPYSLQEWTDFAPLDRP